MSALREFPRVDTAVETPQGRGTIQKLDIFKQVVWIQYEDGNWEDRPLDDVRQMLGLGEDEPARQVRDTESDQRKSRRSGRSKRRGNDD